MCPRRTCVQASSRPSAAGRRGFAGTAECPPPSSRAGALFFSWTHPNPSDVPGASPGSRTARAGPGLRHATACAACPTPALSGHNPCSYRFVLPVLTRPPACVGCSDHLPPPCSHSQRRRPQASAVPAQRQPRRAPSVQWFAHGTPSRAAPNSNDSDSPDVWLCASVCSPVASQLSAQGCLVACLQSSPGVRVEYM